MKKDVRQVILMRGDLNMRKGKMVSQGAHASLGSFLNLMTRTEDENSVKLELTYSKDSDLAQWLDGIFTKITLKVSSESELTSLLECAENMGLNTKKIIDSGKTEFSNIPTLTCGCIGPVNKEDIDEITGHLQLL
jgi:PTH2 family peptidyl-tRNA hydrolase